MARLTLAAVVAASAAVLVLVVYTHAGSTGDGPEDLVCGMDVDKQLKALGVPGFSAVIVKNGRIACSVVGGMANIEERRPVEPDTIFVWASVSKTVTAAAVMQLVDDGAITLDDDINGYLHFPVRNPSCPDDPITFAHLLTHTSSIKENEYEGVYADLYVEGDSPIELGEFLQEYLTASGKHYSPKSNFKKNCPGKAYSYSNIGAGLLGYLVETIAGMPFEQYSRKKLFEPLGMTETAWRLSELDPSRIAMPYRGNHSSGFKPAGHFGFPTYPDGLLRTSPSNLARFLIMFMQLGELDGKRLLSREAVDAMRHVPYPKIAEGQGLIWYYDNVGSRKGLLGHSGSDPGTSSMMFFDPKDDAGVILVANGSWNWDRGEKLVKKLFKHARRY